MSSKIPGKKHPVIVQSANKLEKKLHKLCQTRPGWNSAKKNNEAILACLKDLNTAKTIPNLDDLKLYLKNRRRYDIKFDVVNAFIQPQTKISPKASYVSSTINTYFFSTPIHRRYVNHQRVMDKYDNFLPFFKMVKSKGYIIKPDFYRKFYEKYRDFDQQTFPKYLDIIKYFVQEENCSLDEFIEMLFYSKKILNSANPDHIQSKNLKKAVIDTLLQQLHAINLNFKPTIKDLLKAYKGNYLQTVEIFQEVWKLKPDFDCLIAFVYNNCSKRNSYIDKTLNSLVVELKSELSDVKNISKLFKSFDSPDTKDTASKNTVTMVKRKKKNQIAGTEDVVAKNKIIELFLEILLKQELISLDDPEIQKIIYHNFESITDPKFLNDLVKIHHFKITWQLLLRACKARNSGNMKIIKSLIEDYDLIPDQVCLLYICRRPDGHSLLKYFIDLGIKPDMNCLYLYCQKVIGQDGRRRYYRWGGNSYAKIRMIRLIVENMEDEGVNIPVYSDEE